MKITQRGLFLTAATTLGLFALTACASGSTTAGNSDASDSTVQVDVGNGTITVSNAKPDIAFISSGNNNLTFSAALEAGARAAAGEVGVNLDVFAANFDPALQFTQVQTALSSGKYGAMLIHPMDSSLCETIAESTIEKGILVAVGANPLCPVEDQRGDALRAPGTVTYVGGQSSYDGFTTYLTSVIANAPGPQKVLVVHGTDSNATTLNFEQALADVTSSNPDFEVVGSVYTDWSTPDAYAKTTAALQGNPETTLIVTSYIDMTVGVIEALEALGLSTPVYDVGASEASIAALEGDRISGTWPYFPYDIGYRAVKALLEAAAGERVPALIEHDGNPSFDGDVITRDTIGDFTPKW